MKKTNPRKTTKTLPVPVVPRAETQPPERKKAHEETCRRSGKSDLIMEALADPNIAIIGVCGKDDDRMDNQLEIVVRRVERDGLFGVIVRVSIGENPDLRRIQGDIADQLGFSFQGQENRTTCCFFPSTNNNAITENAAQLSDWIRNQPQILFILRDLHTRLDLVRLGVDPQRCKLILTSQSEDILSNRMNAQRTFRL